MIFQYVRNHKRQKVGVVVAISRNAIGWSKCAFNRGDAFDKDRGLSIAVGRAIKGSTVPVPHDVRNVIKEMSKRASSYFKLED